jgi:hypothetical protein
MLFSIAMDGLRPMVRQRLSVPLCGSLCALCSLFLAQRNGRAAHSPSGDSCPTDNGCGWGACCFLLLWMAYGQRYTNGSLWFSVSLCALCVPFFLHRGHGGCTEEHRGGPAERIFRRGRVHRSPFLYRCEKYVMPFGGFFKAPRAPNSTPVLWKNLQSPHFSTFAGVVSFGRENGYGKAFTMCFARGGRRRHVFFVEE